MKNTIFLLEHGAGVWCDNFYTLAFKVRTVLAEKGRLEAMRRNSLNQGRPDAGKRIARFVIGAGA